MFLPSNTCTETARAEDIHTIDIAGGASGRPAAAVRLRRAFSLRFLVGHIERMAARVDSAETVAYQKAAREAFRAGTLLNAPKHVAPTSSAEFPASPAGRPLGLVAGRVSVQAEPIAKGPGAVMTRPMDETLESEATPADQPSNKDRLHDLNLRQVGVSAPDLLRTPRSVTPVADDFFDGLIRRVEGDR